MYGHYKKNSARIAIVASSFNDFITKRLLNACLMELKRQGLGDDQITTVWVPGAFEIPLTALKLARRKDIDAVICLGAVIRGETYHFEVVSNECARGMMEASLIDGQARDHGSIDDGHRGPGPGARR